MACASFYYVRDCACDWGHFKKCGKQATLQQLQEVQQVFDAAWKKVQALLKDLNQEHLPKFFVYRHSTVYLLFITFHGSRKCSHFLFLKHGLEVHVCNAEKASSEKQINQREIKKTKRKSVKNRARSTRSFS